MKNKFVLGVFFFLTLMTSSVFGSMVENSRQGSPAISAEMHPESTLREPGMLLGLELRFLGFCIRSGIISTDPFGLVWETALQMLRGNPLYSDLADELEGYMSLDDAGDNFSFGKRVLTNKCIPDRQAVYTEVIRDKAMWDYLAKKYGFSKKIPANKAPFYSHGQPVYQKGTHYITPDVDSHIGGYWKLYNKLIRRGTYNEDMEYIGP